MTLEQLNKMYMIRARENGKNMVVFRRRLEEQDKAGFRDVREEDIPVHFPGVELEAAAKTPRDETLGTGAAGADGVGELLTPGPEDPLRAVAPGVDEDWKAQAKKRVQTFGRVDRLLAYATETLHLTIEGDAAALPLAELKAKITEAIEQM